jgi:signal transduction histidine kinase
LQAGRWENAAAELDELARGARAAYADVREAILGLRTTPAGRSFLEALRDYLERYRLQADLEVDLDIDQREGDLDERLGLEPSAELQLLRILQEALSNVRRHAGVDRARLTIRCEGGEIVAQVEDTGRGFDIASSARHRGPHFGLATMRERAEGVGGKLEVRSAPGGGTVVTVRLPRSGGGTTERSSETDAHPSG